MNKWIKMYNEKLVSAEKIAKKIGSNTVCSSPIAGAESYAITEAIARRALEENLSNIKQCSLLSIRPKKIWDPRLNGKFNHVTCFTSANARKALWNNRCEFIPSFYHEIPDVWKYSVRPEVFYATVSPMDEHGYFSLGIGVSTCKSLIETAKKIYLEVNEYMPRIHGDSFIHISQVDAICECHKPLPELPSNNITDIDKIIGNYIAELVPNEATIQLGIGAIPNAAAQSLSTKKDLGIHTEMFTESMIDLIENGVVTNRKKNIHKGKSIATLALGTKRMYDFLNDNVGIEFYPVDYVNDPNIIGMHDDFISINTCIEVDLFGQVCSESLGVKHFSGVGGQVDYVRGAAKSKNGKSIIAMYSTAKNGTISKIKPILTKGSIVTTTRNEVDYIITEFGVAKLKGKTISQRAKSLINIAHPNFRDELTSAAKKMNLI
ncbi:acetyl-CoA hydrolase/transferase family protein [Caldisalinibacter kiritimatiensis]|uniref:4-hydroxybutyrate:acetyl-CoA CoA transferase n=1 Tax=Caldisalinibacter kiritimatiensis TaxID=1304284 RepID=R1CW52_9FIRM|nr:acetyl-CoA hydrolase/transferase C-terminal domain-containing protein [Caldisalinibacter kiritimatiensis]EOD00864.1 4-hydroxybutyrate:acetyl-CoA CoA transferase [Caldisalinibacter kiritimatiensis]